MLPEPVTGTTVIGAPVTSLRPVDVAVFLFGRDTLVLTAPIEDPFAEVAPTFRQNGVTFPGRFFSFAETDGQGSVLLISVIPTALEVGDRISWAMSSDLVLADGIIGADLRVQPSVEFSTALDSLGSTSARYNLLRRLSEAILNYLKRRSDVDVSRNLSRLFLKTLEGVHCQPRVVARVTADLTILELPHDVTYREVEAVTIVEADGIRSSLARPIEIDGGDAQILILNLPLGRLPETAVVLWASESTRLLTFRGVSAIDQSSFVHSVIENRPGFWQRQLQESIGLVGTWNDETEAFCRTLSAVAARIAPKHLDLRERIQAGISLCLRAPGGLLCVMGWLVDPSECVREIYWVGSGKVRVPLRLGSSPRLDHHGIPASVREARRSKTNVGDHGFVASIKTPAPAVALGQERFVVELRSGVTYDLISPAPPASYREARDAILAMPKPDGRRFWRSLSVMAPAIARFHELALSGSRVQEIVEIGEQVLNPRVSIVVPVFRNLDYIKSQYTCFALDRSAASDELIYVCDDPTVEDSLIGLLRALHGLYGLPVRIVVLRQNYGYAAASNEGVGAGSADHVLLLNSDAVPARAGLVKRLLRRMRRASSIVAVGAKLLFSDRSIQHLGLTHFSDSNGRISNRSLQKGYPESCVSARRARTVEASTGACLLLRRDKLEQVGGISESYVIGDFEDTDLCRKLTRDGGRIVVARDCELFHFERQSIEMHDTHLYSVAELYNQWLHQTRWFSTPENLPVPTERTAVPA